MTLISVPHLRAQPKPIWSALTFSRASCAVPSDPQPQSAVLNVLRFLENRGWCYVFFWPFDARSLAKHIAPLFGDIQAERVLLGPCPAQKIGGWVGRFGPFLLRTCWGMACAHSRPMFLGQAL